MWTEFVIAIVILIAFGFAVPYIGDKSFMAATPNFCVHDCYGNSSCDNQDIHWGCVYGTVECKVGWYIWCLT
jgi:hypothetical protein